MITLKTAQKIASNWHGGQYSALYQFASSGYFVAENSILYLWEIMQDLQNEYFAPCPRTLTNTEVKELNNLKNYFEAEIKRATFLEIEYKKHPVYGYQYPDAITGNTGILGLNTIRLQN